MSRETQYKSDCKWKLCLLHLCWPSYEDKSCAQTLWCMKGRLAQVKILPVAPVPTKLKIIQLLAQTLWSIQGRWPTVKILPVPITIKINLVHEPREVWRGGDCTWWCQQHWGNVFRVQRVINEKDLTVLARHLAHLLGHLAKNRLVCVAKCPHFPSNSYLCSVLMWSLGKNCWQETFLARWVSGILVFIPERC